MGWPQTPVVAAATVDVATKEPEQGQRCYSYQAEHAPIEESNYPKSPPFSCCTQLAN